MAAQDGHVDVAVRLLAAPGLDVNKARTTDGATPLYMARRTTHRQQQPIYTLHL